MTTLFQRIIQGECPCHFIAETDHFFSFLDIRPIATGHTLVVPKVPVDDVFDLDTDTLSRYLPAAQPIATALRAVVPCQRIGMMVAGLDVPHAHLHLIPIQTIHDLDVRQAKPGDPDTLAALAKRIREALSTH